MKQLDLGNVKPADWAGRYDLGVMLGYLDPVTHEPISVRELVRRAYSVDDWGEVWPKGFSLFDCVQKRLGNAPDGFVCDYMQDVWNELEDAGLV